LVRVVEEGDRMHAGVFCVNVAVTLLFFCFLCFLFCFLLRILLVKTALDIRNPIPHHNDSKL